MDLKTVKLQVVFVFEGPWFSCVEEDEQGNLEQVQVSNPSSFLQNSLFKIRNLKLPQIYIYISCKFFEVAHVPSFIKTVQSRKKIPLLEQIICLCSLMTNSLKLILIIKNEIQRFPKIMSSKKRDEIIYSKTCFFEENSA